MVLSTSKTRSLYFFKVGHDNNSHFRLPSATQTSSQQSHSKLHGNESQL